MKKIFALLLCVILFCNDTTYTTLLAQKATTVPSQDTTNTQDTTEAKDATQNTTDSKNGASNDATTNPSLNIESASAVLIEGSTGSILYEKNKDE